ncbi:MULTISPECIES: acyl-CoA thioesterase II [Rhizobiaceae]|uniref:Acyl-CoA thioesterase 2 n=1 Tax=Aliirhizobium cellulosilyticum TaxID=393664 RepID=A0A7W6V289_9HYPH|nr:acyl-CoA thioesterase II [Rhizobium cellulosilyticum]MBB4351013.1 acyl-CoA thioesterase-2 [Rhizobium cellulosilyticum]MBB4414000.1 acyl-CoA thioesterase-2 [Rhizobium cellulosilyticum]MBB4448615.1 acyl-CoA thioesterase-2 [Rhizobium cellulosilyticum]
MSGSRPNPMEQLIKTLDLEQLEHNLYRGTSPDIGWQRVFGGQVIAQALVAAQRTVDADRFVHSLHAYFVRPGDPSVPIVYQVERLRDGGSFATRQVQAIQHGRAIFTLSSSFQRDEEGYEHQIALPDVPAPEELMDEAEFKRIFLPKAPEAIRRYWERPRPIELRPTSLKHYLTTEKLEPLQDVWVRTVGDVPGDRGLQAAILAYLSDMTLLDASLYPHGTSVFDPRLQAASLDHAMWFHRPIRFDEWLLYSQDSPSASGGRGMTRGSLYTRSGVLVASVAQEGLIRKKANE